MPANKQSVGGAPSLHWPTDAEEAAIQRGIAADPDNPEWTEEDFARAPPAARALPPPFLVAHAPRRRGRSR